MKQIHSSQCNRKLVHHPVFILGYALSCTTLRVVGITTRSVVQLSLPTQVFSLDDALAAGREPSGHIHRSLLAAILVTSLCLSTALAQEKTAIERPASPFIASPFIVQNDLVKYAADAAKWDKDVDKLAANIATDSDEDAILCLGSSSFRLWDTIAEDMSPYKVVRRAYGGAKYCDLAIQTPKLVEGLRFRAAMIFIGNDITGKEKDKTPEEIVRLSKIVMDTVRKQHPEAPIFLIAVTPSPSRFEHWPKISKANQSLEKLAMSEKGTFFVSTQSKYLNEQGEPMTELFVKDMLHQNKAGYAIWSSILKDALNKNLK